MSEAKVIVIPDGKICDYIDGKFRNDTPEEYVRQTIEKRLVNEHKYSPAQISIEYTLQLGSRKPRADIVIFERMVSKNDLPIPLLKNRDIQEKINSLALLANEKRYEAYVLEQQALEIMDKEVIYVK